MSEGTTVRRWLERFEMVTVSALELLLVLTIAVATILLFALFFTSIGPAIGQIFSADFGDRAGAFHQSLQRTFGGVLIVLLGLELMDTLKVYFKEHRLRVEVILIVAMIAVGRHIIQVDFEHASLATLLGSAALMLALAGGYFLVKKSHVMEPAGGPPNAA